MSKAELLMAKKILNDKSKAKSLILLRRLKAKTFKR